jgi:hypothetical protein
MHHRRTRYGRSLGAPIHRDAFCATKSGAGKYIRSCHAEDQSDSSMEVRAGGVDFVTCFSTLCIKFSPKVLEVLNTPPLEIKDDEDPLVRLKKERFNAALNEAKARFDLYKRGLTKGPHLVEVGERLFGAEVDLYDKPEDRARVLQRQLDVYNEAKGNLEKQVKRGSHRRLISNDCDTTRRRSKSTF